MVSCIPRSTMDQDQANVFTPSYQVKTRRLKKDGTPYKPRRGWGPYRSVPNERSVAFNLQLDVQNLQQEIQNLLALRDILATKVLVQRYTAEGSLCKLVNEYLYVFRKGVVPQVRRKRLMDDQDQRAFMHRVMDPEVDLGNGLPRGPDVIMDQMANYSNFLNFISLTGTVDSIVVAEDSVLVSDTASFVFQVTRSTIEMIFPHIMGNEWLVAQLVGQQVEAQGRSTFHFNTAGKCYRYDVEMNFVTGFMNVVHDPLIVDALLGQALITDNGMIGLVNEPNDEEEKAPVPVYTGDNSNRGELQQGSRCAQEDSSSQSDSVLRCSTSEEFCRRLAEDYFTAFANGYQESKDSRTPLDIFQRDFFLHRFGVQDGVATSHVKKRWSTLEQGFELLSFQQKGATETYYYNNITTCSVTADATYTLCVTLHTVQTVFPHLTSLRLINSLVGKVIMVPSRIFLSIEKSTGYIIKMSEKMNFEQALAEMLQDEYDVSRVVTHALLTNYDINFDRSSYATATSLQQHIQLPHPSGNRSTSQKASLAAILNAID